MPRKLAGSFVLVLLAVISADASTLTGRVRVAGRKAGAAAVRIIVYAERLGGGGQVQPDDFKIAQRDKTFSPRVLAIPVGSTIHFPNEDPISHNVFSLSRPPFDLGLYRAGESKSRVFGRPGTFWIFCNIHPQMAAAVLVVPTSYIAEADAAGDFRLELPAGRYTVTAWSERSRISSGEITVGATSETVDLTLDESRHVDIPHKNKYGNDYPKAAYENKD